jgi:S-formylglutathione hydrolase FrmB
MALLQVNFNSTTLHCKVPMQVILPTDAHAVSTGPFKTLYLLHGLMDTFTAWTSNTRIERWAMERHLAVVMPYAENSFYVDIPYGSSVFGDFGAYVGQELVEITRRMFRLSPKRDDTFIGGLSMGGFGALRNGLKYARGSTNAVESDQNQR